MTDNLPDVIWASAYPYPEWARSESLIKYTVNLSGADGYAKYTRAQPKYKQVDLDAMIETVCRRLHSQAYCNENVDNEWTDFEDDAKSIIYDIKSRYGDLYTIERE